MTTTDMPNLLGPEDRPACDLIPAGPEFPALVVCDHASRLIPEPLGNLAVPEQFLDQHIAWDIGAGPLARTLAGQLGISAVLAGYSRLVVDCNRNLDDPTAFPVQSDDVSVPGNQGLGQQERAARADTFYWPYHHTVRDQLRALERLEPAPALISIHTFTPELDGIRRPWHVGILWDKDPRIPVPLMEALRGIDGVEVGDNLPYSGKHPADFTVDHHAEAEGLPHVGIEVRQDLVDTEAGVTEWAARIAAALVPILKNCSLYTNRAGTVPGS